MRKDYITPFNYGIDSMFISFRNSSEKNSNKRLTAALLAMVMLFFVLFSVFFIAHEADHECSGEGCPVCALIQMCEDNIRQLGSGTAVSAAESVLVFLTLAMPVFTAFAINVSTPVSKKIRLNN